MLVEREPSASRVLAVIMVVLVPACQTPAALMELPDARARYRQAEESRRLGWWALPEQVE